MRKFAFDIKAPKKFSTEDNGWTCKMKCSNKIGFFYLRSPIIKEITYSKGVTIRSGRHTVLGIGYVDNGFVFKGVALFDFSVRGLIVLGLLMGISYAARNIYSGSFWAGIFYLLITFLSWDDDDLFLHKARMMCQMQSHC